MLNPPGVFSPYWKDSWVDSNSPPCPPHRHWVGYVNRKDLHERRNLRELLKMLERRWLRIERERKSRS